MLMAVLSQYKFEEYNKDNLNHKKEGVIIIFEKIQFDKISSGRIPALLPMYIVDLKSEYSDSD